MKIKEFMERKKTELADFDFMEDTMKKYSDLKGQNDIVDLYIMYKDGKFDPDLKSQLLQDIYGSLWNDITDKWFMKIDGWIQSDTMTSAQNFINKGMELYDNDETHNNGKRLSDIEGCWLANQKHYSTEFMKRVYKSGESEKEFLKAVFEKYGLDELIATYHTIGNFCPVPCYFNGARSGGYASHDFWDLTLMKIREYYLCDNSTEKVSRIIGDELLHHNGNALACKAWLDEFGNGIIGWKNFVKFHYFDNYVDKDYNVIPFWEEHDWDHNSISNDTKKFTEAIQEITRRIKSRGEIIIAAIKEKEERNARK